MEEGGPPRAQSPLENSLFDPLPLGPFFNLQAIVSKEEEACSQQAEEARVMKEECQADLDQALPALNAALDALKGLKKNDITEVKNLKTPPDGVIVVSKAMCWCFDVKPKKVTAADGRTKVDDYWEPAKKSVWGDSKLIDRILDGSDHVIVRVIGNGTKTASETTIRHIGRIYIKK